MSNINLYAYDMKNIYETLELSSLIASPRWNAYIAIPTSPVLFDDE